MATGSLTDALRETLALFEDPGSPVTTSEVADRLDLGRRSTYDRLDRLVDLDELKTKKVGSNGRVWWRSASTPRSGPSEPPETGPSGIDGDTQFGSLVDAVEEYAIFILDPEGTVRSWNDGARTIKGYTEDEIVGESFTRFYTEDDRAAGVPERNLAVAAEQGDVEDEGWRLREDGTRFWANVTITAFYDEAGEIRGFTKVTRDMTERREREQAIKRERDLVEQIFEASSVGLAVLSRDGVERINARGREIAGISDDDVGEPTIYDESGDVVTRERRPDVRVFETGEPVTGWECQLERPDGTRRLLSVSATPIADDGEVERVVVATEDITQLKEQARQLERQRDHLESELDEVFDRISNGFVGLDDELRFTYVNDHAEALLGLDDEVVIGRDIREDVDLPDSFEDALREALRGQDPAYVEYYYDHLDAWLESSIYPSETGVSVYFRDVTERKTRERELERYGAIVDAVGEPLYELDAEGRFTFVNDPLVEQSGYDEDELLGQHVSIGMDEEALARVRSEISDHLDDGSSGAVTVETDVVRKDGARIPVENRVSVLTDADGEVRGTAGILWDISERKSREQELELYETIVETIDDGVYVLDDEYHFTEVNDAYAEMTGYDREELLGTHCTLVIDEDVSAQSAEQLESIIAGDERSASIEADILRADGSRLRAESKFTAIESPDDGHPKKVGVVRDVSERVAHERELEQSEQRYRTLVDNFPNGIVTLFDEDFRYLIAGGELLETFGSSADELVGRTIYELNTPGDVEVLEPAYEAVFEGESNSFEAEYADRAVRIWTVPVTDEAGDVFAGMAMSQDVTQRKEREEALRDAKLQLEAATEAGSVGTWEWKVSEDEFVAGPSFAETFGVDPDAARTGVPLEEFMSAVHEDDRDRIERKIDEAVSSCSEYEAEYRVSDAEGGVRWVVARGHVECDEDGTPLTFPGAIVDITDRKRSEQELERQRRQLQVLNNLNEVVRDLSQAIIDQSTREEIETVVCEGLAESESYSFAWVGDVDPRTQTVRLRTEIGVDGYLDDASISGDPDDPRGAGPTGRAIRTHEVQVTEDTLEDDDFEPWRDRARELGFRSSAAIPIVHEGALYGVLNVYADRPNAFGGNEREVIGHLGEVVGHAIAAVEQRRALTSDEVVELEFQISNVQEAFDLPASGDGRLTLDRSVPTGDDTYLVYGSATDDMLDVLDALVETLPSWESPRLFGDATADGVTRFELRLVEPPVLSTVTSLGGYVERATIEDGDYFMRVHLAPGADVRRLQDLVRDAYPMAQLVSRQQITRTPDSPKRFSSVFDEQLTDRQRGALEAGYFGGYFEWPRESTGEELADSLGISAATFHQHLRNAHRKILQIALEEDSTT